MPDPALFGLVPGTTRLEVWTAFDQAPVPQKTEVVVKGETNAVVRALMSEPDLVDSTLDFGAMQMIPGKCFPLNAASPNPKPGADVPDSAPVFKRWQRIGQDQRDVLIESAEFSAIQPHLRTLPPWPLTLDVADAAAWVSEQRILPPAKAVQAVDLPIKVVAEPAGDQGFALDYTLVYSTSSWTFYSGVTYVVDGSFTISSSTVIQTNAIIKYRRNGVLTLSGSLTTPSTGPPAILTSFDDYTAGELIPGGTPVGYVATTALSLYNVFNYYGTYVQNLEIRHARTAINYYSPSGSHTIKNCRFYVCQTGLNAYYTSVGLQNSVMCGVPIQYTNYPSYPPLSVSGISTDCQRTADTGGNNWYGQRNVPEGLTNVVAVAGGWDYSMALKADGTVVAWGANEFGQTNVPSGLTNVIGIAAGDYHCLALKADGKVVAWGYNAWGQTNVSASATNVIDVKAGFSHSLALKADGTVVTWGLSDLGLSPVPSDVTNVVAISASGYSSMALRSNGTIRAWGGQTSDPLAVPDTLTNAVAVSVEGCYGLGLKGDGTLVGWGCNYWGQASIPSDVSNVVAMSTAGGTSAVLKRDGTVRTWGFYQWGNTNLPAGLSGVVALDGRGMHVVFVRAGPATPTIATQPFGGLRFVGGSITFTVGTYSPTALSYQWQFNGTNISAATNTSLTLNNLQLTNSGNYTVIVSNSSGSITSATAVLTVVGEPIILSQPSDLRVLTLSNVTFLVTASNAVQATYFWLRNGTNVYASTSNYYNFGLAYAMHQGSYSVIVSNSAGAVTSDPWFLHVVLPGQAIGWGDSGYAQTNAPYSATDLVAVAAGQHHSLALKEDGTVIGWGTGEHGETNAPSGLNDVVAIGAGASHNLALKGNGTVAAWGDNSWGQTNVPSGLSGVKAIAAGYWHSLALRTNGTVVAWGYNNNEQTNVPSGLNAVAISAGWQHSLALRSDGTVCTWGLNNGGQCDVPVGLSNVVAISAGIWHSLALKADGTVAGWGANTYGEASPPAGLSNVLAIAGGGQFSLALKNDGSVVAWGKAFFGVTNVPVPLGDVKDIAAGFDHALALTYSPVLNYPVNVSQDLLLIYNTNCTDSAAVMNYYRTNRPVVSNANVLGIGGATTNAERYVDLVSTTNTLITPVLTWLTNNPTKRPNYIIMLYGVPASTIPPAGLGGVPSSSYILWSLYPSRKPFVTHINMRTPQDCFAYVDKLANFGTSYSPGRIYISPSAAGYSNTNYHFDDVRAAPPYGDNLPGTCGSNGVINFGGSTSQIAYVGSTNFNDHLFNCTNVAGYLSWGYHGGLVTGFPTNGWVRFYGSSGWYIIQTMESFNGQWVPFDFQTSFHDYFSSNAFWGANYSHTPAGTITHTYEPGIGAPCGGGVGDSFLVFGLWQGRKNFGICAWSARRTDFFQAVGDPFLIK